MYEIGVWYLLFDGPPLHLSLEITSHPISKFKPPHAIYIQYLYTVFIPKDREMIIRGTSHNSVIIFRKIGVEKKKVV